jgi:acyl-CoA synthetase (AMP-forming)/AMP-acid ligase II/acyl carrier protein
MEVPSSAESETGEGNSIHEILRLSGSTLPDSPVLLASNRPPLSWAALGAQRDHVGEVLAGLGLGRRERIAVVLPDGPELAAAFLTVSACATFAPLNPAYRSEEFEFCLTDLRAKALILPAGLESPARTIARKHGVAILELTSARESPAGQFVLNSRDCARSSGAVAVNWSGPDDVALMLHTSGTTSRPKLVPLTHRNLCSSARHIARTLGLTPADRGLCVMPLFHIHGLIGALLSSAVAGASVVCAPGFVASRFFEWLDEFKPTWFTAVPTMHQAILALAAANLARIKRSPLRLIRSSSSALPPAVMHGLEEAFGAPVIESYGMTEASHQMASNPLPPGVRKPGSVGPAAGPEVAVMDETGRLLAAGETGEIVIRGPNVTAGYEKNPAANAAAFTNGWFRTGDQGYLDPEGYLFVSGRLKELINRGGEKIAPREVDEALLKHPAVRQAVAFALPHPTLGEDLAAAVVTQGGQTVSESELRGFVAQRLPPFKVPSRIVMVKDIPKGPTGKIQRLGLGARLAEQLSVFHEPPAEGMEQRVAATIREVLACADVGRHDNFFVLGGDSIRATQVIARLARDLSVEVPPTLLFTFPTVQALAAELAQLAEAHQIETLAAGLSQLSPEEAVRLVREQAAAKP